MDRESPYMFERTAQVIVGEEKVNFVIHMDVLCKRSRFFQSACKDTWNAERKPIKLPDATPRTFSHYLRCAYQGEIDADDQNRPESFTSLVNLYVLADTLGDLASANMVIDKIIQYGEELQIIPSDEVTLVYESTPETSPLRRLMVD